MEFHLKDFQHFFIVPNDRMRDKTFIFIRTNGVTLSQNRFKKDQVFL